HDFAGAGDAVDANLAIDVAFGQRHEEVPRAHDLVDTLDSLDAVRQRRHTLRAADAVDFGDSQLMAGRQNVAVVAAKRSGWQDDGNRADASDAGGNGRHQQCRRIGGGTPGNADPDASERQITLPELDPPAARRGPFEHDVAVEEARLKIGDTGHDA